jgi:hypothetical protein
MNGFIESAGRKIEGFITTHWLITFVVIVALIIFSMVTMFGWIGASAEGITGSSSAMVSQIRDGPGESIPRGSVLQDYATDPNKLCMSAGEPTDDPWAYLGDQLNDRSESMATPDELDAKLIYASQH